ncbi:MAG: ABC transporter ATP-binding protein [Clostridia bacterium]|nr:ABC transporter ATP-binding protein [Clostridia bacterium]
MKKDTIKEAVAAVGEGEILLSVRDIHVFYGLIEAIKGVSFEVRRGEIIALIGANGAGKTTVMHTISGLIRPKSGSILLGGAEITQIPAHRIVSLGLAQVPEGRRVFQELTVYENLMLGAYVSSDKAESEEMLEKVYQRFPRLEERKKQSAGTLSGGEQQMLAMGRALMSRPDIILMDEPSMGLSPLYVNEVFDIIKEINGSGTTVLLVEQNAKKALAAADRAYVLETGRIALEGKASDLMDNAQVRRAYLGEE